MSSKRALATGLITKKWLRRLFQSLGTLLPSIMLCIISFVPGLSANQILVLLIFGMSVNGFVSGGYQMSYMDCFSPAYATFIFSLGNVLSTLNGSVSVYLVGYILDVSNFNWTIIWMIGVSFWVTALFPFLLFLTSEEQKFEEKEGAPNDEKTVLVK